MKIVYRTKGNVGLDFLLFFVFFICALKLEALVLAFELSSITS